MVIPSLSGTTKESVELLAFLKERGVRTISLTGHEDTPLAQEADHNFTNFAEDDTSSEIVLPADPADRPGAPGRARRI